MLITRCAAFVSFVLIFGFASLASAATQPGRVEFEVLREGHAFGRQSVTVSIQGGDLVAQTGADLRAALGPITLFRYTQRCREVWREAALISIHCATRQNGRGKNVAGRLTDGALQMNGVSGAVSFAPATRPTSWWTRPPLSTREMINSETGERLPVRVSFIGRETIVVNGRTIAADHIRVQGTLAVDLWYDDAGHWVNCAFTMQGQRFTYRLLTAPADAPA